MRFVWNSLGTKLKHWRRTNGFKWIAILAFAQFHCPVSTNLCVFMSGNMLLLAIYLCLNSKTSSSALVGPAFLRHFDSAVVFVNSKDSANFGIVKANFPAKEITISLLLYIMCGRMTMDFRRRTTKTIFSRKKNMKLNFSEFFLIRGTEMDRNGQKWIFRVSDGPFSKTLRL